MLCQYQGSRECISTLGAGWGSLKECVAISCCTFLLWIFVYFMCLSQHVGGRKLWGLQFRQLKTLLIVKGKEALCELAYNVFLRVWKTVSVVLQLEILYWWKTLKKKNILKIQEFIVSVPGHEYKWVLGLSWFAYAVWTYVYNGEVFCVDIGLHVFCIGFYSGLVGCLVSWLLE